VSIVFNGAVLPLAELCCLWVLDITPPEQGFGREDVVSSNALSKFSFGEG
jgi:hypothetical protein